MGRVSVVEKFSCCAAYMECSKVGKCIKSQDDRDSCNYAKKLEDGKNFYAVTNRILVSPPIIDEYSNDPNAVYIACYKQLFKVYRRSRGADSYQFKDYEKEKVIEAFRSLSIPYRIQYDPNEILPGDVLKVEGNNDKRVTFEIGEDKYNMKRHNGWFMNEVYAQKIVAALQAKGLEARVEQAGRCAEKRPTKVLEFVKEKRWCKNDT